MSLDERFDVKAAIHIGQTATAYEAVQRGLDRKVLLKIIHPQWENDPELLERFSREGKAAARVSHQNVVKIFDIGWDDGLPFIVLEWIDGGTLANRLKDGPLPQNDVRKIAVELLRGLSAVHRAHMLHRDIKPDNIMLGADGEARLTDFSLAGLGHLSILTGHEGIVGSPAYMAPELLKGISPDTRSDLYSLGLTLFEALTGSNPYKTDDPIASINLVSTTDPPKLTGRTRIDAGLARLIDALLARNPEQRPHSAEAALALLTGETKEEAVVASKQIVSITNLDRIGYVSISLAAAFVLILLLIIGDYVRTDYPKVIFNRPTLTDSGLPSAEKAKPEESPKIVNDNNQEFSAVSPPVKQVDLILTGVVVLKVHPWGNVSIDGVSYGMTPVAPLELLVGDHRLVVTHPQLPEFNQSFRVESGKQDTVVIDLLKAAASAFISAVPWGYLTIDGDSMGLLPRSDPVWLTAGRHSLGVTHPDFGVFSQEISLAPGERVSYRIDMNSGTLIATPLSGEDSKRGEGTR